MTARALGYTLSRRRRAIPVGMVLATLAFLLGRPAVAHAAGIDDETVFVLNTFSFLVWGALVMWMCAGFTMLESGSVRTKNATSSSATTSCTSASAETSACWASTSGA